jgi:hypothetical protein
MENTTAVTQLSEEQAIALGHELIAESSAYELFTRTRDYYVEAGECLCRSVGSRKPTIDEKQLAKTIEKNIRLYQSCVDAAFEFDQIIETGNLAVN